MATTITGTDGPDDLEGVGDSEVYGLDGNDTLTALDESDSLYGGEGDDKLYDSPSFTDGALLVGGEGDDSYYAFTSYGEPIIMEAVEDPDGGHDTVYVPYYSQEQPGGTFVLPDNIEDLFVGRHSGSLYGNAEDNVIAAGGHNSIYGLDGNDSIHSTTFDSHLYGGEGADTLAGDANGDTLEGGAGDDVIYVSDARDTVMEGLDAGHDTVRSSANYLLTANVEDLVLEGTASRGQGNGLDNRITGNGENNLLIGRGGSDTLIGGLGDDVYGVDDSGDVVREKNGEGMDLVRASVDFTLGRGLENLVLQGKQAIDGTGNNLDNEITGNGAENRIIGGDGADTLDGGRGDDVMRGGVGDDQFVFGYRYGADVIERFDANGDVVAFDSRVFADADAVLAAATQDGAHVVIDAGVHGSLTLEMTQLGDLSSADFLFF